MRRAHSPWAQTCLQTRVYLMVLEVADGVVTGGKLAGYSKAVRRSYDVLCHILVWSSMLQDS